ncbi:MAG TPA: hypothetical protein VG737_06375, partial [Cyclobacteriaceae bacterium]|nr:hypothetical protein [Cyclobacteriaceae bacterium]
GSNLNIVNNYTGNQYTDGDNTEAFAMKGYAVTNVWLARPFGKKHLTFTANGEVNNVFNTEYQARTGYPMPGRNFKIGLIIQFKKPHP